MNEPTMKKDFKWSKDKKTVTISAKSEMIWDTEDLITQLTTLKETRTNLNNQMEGLRTQFREMKKNVKRVDTDINELTDVLSRQMGVLDHGKDSLDE